MHTHTHTHTHTPSHQLWSRSNWHWYLKHEAQLELPPAAGAWRGVARRGVAWRGVAWRGVAWRGVAWRGVAWRGVAWRGVAWRGVARCGRGAACRGNARVRASARRARRPHTCCSQRPAAVFAHLHIASPITHCVCVAVCVAVWLCVCVCVCVSMSKLRACRWPACVLGRRRPHQAAHADWAWTVQCAAVPLVKRCQRARYGGCHRRPPGAAHTTEVRAWVVAAVVVVVTRAGGCGAGPLAGADAESYARVAPHTHTHTLAGTRWCPRPCALCARCCRRRQCRSRGGTGT
jgi:hypothetical protein